jgi:thioredoxin-related protein
MKFTFKPALIVLIFVTATGVSIAQTEGLQTVTDFRIEAKAAQKIKAPILVLFMSNTCHYCEIVLQDFLLPMQRDRSYDNKVILRQIETGSREKLIDFNGQITSQGAFASKHKAWGVPTVMLFDSQGNELTSIAGLLTVDYYLAYLDNAINESQEKIKGRR